MKNKFIIGVVCAALVISVIYNGFNYYMASIWDHHIVAKLGDYHRYKHFSLREADANWSSSLKEKEFEALPEIYKTDIEILKKDDQYLWASNDNQVLTKSIEWTPYKQYGREIGMKWVVFQNQEKTFKFTIQANHFMNYFGYNSVYGCFPHFYWSGNSAAEYLMKDGDVLRVTYTVKVFENLQQYLACGYQKLP